MRWSAILLCVLAIRTAADPTPPSLARVKERVLQDLHRLPNCTCTETIERSYRFPWKAAFALGGHPYLLPVRAVTTCSFGKHPSRLKNEIEFSDYRKYSVESKIGFEPAEK